MVRAEIVAVARLKAEALNSTLLSLTCQFRGEFFSRVYKLLVKIHLVISSARIRSAEARALPSCALRFGSRIENDCSQACQIINSNLLNARNEKRENFANATPEICTKCIKTPSTQVRSYRFIFGERSNFACKIAKFRGA